MAQNDLRMAAKVNSEYNYFIPIFFQLAAMLDKRLGLFGNDELSKEEREKDIQLGVDLVGQSKNPHIRQAKNVLMDVDADEISPEEEELLRMCFYVNYSELFLGRSGSKTNGNAEELAPFQRDDSILKALDMLVLYLRIVHSIDFYGHLDYPNEDNMPSRYIFNGALILF